MRKLYFITANLILAATIIFTLLSCSTNGETPPEVRGNAIPIEESHLAIIEQMGLDASDIFTLDNYYVVEGDILIDRDSLEKHFMTEDATRSYYYYGKSRLVTGEKNIRIGIASGVDSQYTTILRNAIRVWNAVEDCDLNFIEQTVDPENMAHILLTKSKDMSEVQDMSLSMTELPTGGRPGKKIIINNYAWNWSSSSSTMKLYNLIHAMGHAIGFAHSVDQIAVAQIEGVGGSEGESFMKLGHNANVGWEWPYNSFSPYDLKAISKLYGSEAQEPQPEELNPGSITSSLTINSGTQTSFTISSTKDASGGSGTISYSWEVNAGSGWININNSGKSLTTQPAQVATARYRRTARSAGESKVSNICTVTDTYYTTCQPGKIESEKIVFSRETFTIGSLSDGHCKTQGPLTYSWEADLRNGWETIPGNDKTLTTTAPEVFSSRYRRLSTCEHGTEPSNICNVINTTYIESMGGRIPETKLINHYKWFLADEIESLEPAASELGEISYQWEINRGSGWENYTLTGNYTTLTFGDPFVFDEVYFRRKAISKYGISYSNECYAKDMFYPNYGGLGNSYGEPIPLGRFYGNFSVRNAIDLSHQGFRDVDRMTNYGNDGFISFKIDRPMKVKIVLSHYLMGDIHLRLELLYTLPNGYPWSDIILNDHFSYQDNLDIALQSRAFDIIDQDPNNYMEFDLEPGEYLMQIQCTKGSNAGSPNKVVYYHIIGTVQ